MPGFGRDAGDLRRCFPALRDFVGRPGALFRDRSQCIGESVGVREPVAGGSSQARCQKFAQRWRSLVESAVFDSTIFDYWDLPHDEKIEGRAESEHV